MEHVQPAVNLSDPDGRTVRSIHPPSPSTDTHASIPSMARLNPEADADSSDGDFEDAVSKPSKKDRVKAIGAQAKHIPKRMLMRMDVLEKYDTQMDNEGDEVKGITDNPAFNTGQVFKKQRKRNNLSSTLKSVPKTLDTLVHPKKAIKAQAASSLPVKEQPYLHPETDKDLVEAHDKLYEASTNGAADSDAVEERQRRVQEISRDRERMRTAWITGKHVKRVRVVPRDYLPFPTIANYHELDANGHYAGVQWGKYLAHLLLYVSQDFTSQYIDDTNQMIFKRSILIRQAERFFVATAPWQSWLMNVRKVYLWEDPWVTGRWLALYLLLLKMCCIPTFFYSYVFYMVLKNRFIPQSVRAIREGHERAMDRSAQVLKLSELIERHGNDGWLDPLLDNLGPLIQQQLGDLADYLEILYNFYHWKDPAATFSSLCFWIACAATAAFTNAEFGEKIFFFVCGLWFFASRPIASRFPKYRKAVSLFRWIYWETPTAAEMAFRQLRQQAEETRKGMVDQTNEDVATAHRFEPPPQLFNARNPPSLESLETSDSSSENVAQNDSQDSDSDEDEASSSVSSSQVFGEVQSILTNKDIISFRGRWSSKAGRLIINTSGIRFSSTAILDVPPYSKESRNSTSSDPREFWHRPYEHLTEMRKSKIQSKVLIRRKLIPAQCLTLIWTDGTEDHITGMRKRDEAFNTILGFSSGRWQQLQPRPEDIGGNQKPMSPLATPDESAHRTDFFTPHPSKTILMEV